MPKKLHVFIVNDINFSGYFNLLVDLAPDLLHIDLMSILLRYLQNGEPAKEVSTFLELQNLENHIGGSVAQQVFKYSRDDCKWDFTKFRGQS